MLHVAICMAAGRSPQSDRNLDTTSALSPDNNILLPSAALGYSKCTFGGDRNALVGLVIQQVNHHARQFIRHDTAGASDEESIYGGTIKEDLSLYHPPPRS